MMCFKKKINLCARSVIVVLSVATLAPLQAAEWKIEPSIFFKTQYNDNVRLRTDANAEGSTGFTLEPRVKFAAEEQQRWDMSFDTRAKVTRFQDIEDGDSENLFFVFDSGRQTERSDWRLNVNYEDNTNFDTDFDTSNPDVGLGLIGDQTQRKTLSITPSVSWVMSETSQISFSLNATEAKYDEVTSTRFTDYENQSAQLSMNWRLSENHLLGFTSSYSEYDSSDADFSYDQTVLQLDYTYTINPTSEFGFSFGGRRLDSLVENTTIGCANPGEFEALGRCLFSAPILGDLETSNDGIVTNVSYSSSTERSSHRFSGGRTVQPSSFGAAQEVRQASYQFSFKNTERFTTRLILDASKYETLSGVAGSDFDDRVTYRIEPSIGYKLTKNWNLDVRYRYFVIDEDNRNEDKASNAIFVNLYLHWPKLVTTY